MYLQQDDCFFVFPGDRLGFLNELDLSPVAYEFAPSGLEVPFLNLENRTLPTIGAVENFDPLSLPYDFAAAAYYDAGRGKTPAAVEKNNKIKTPRIQHLAANGMNQCSSSA